MKISLANTIGSSIFVANLCIGFAQAQSCGVPTPQGSTGQYDTACSNLTITPGVSPSYSNLNVNTTISNNNSGGDAIVVYSGTLGSLNVLSGANVSNSVQGGNNINVLGTVTTLSNQGTLGGYAGNGIGVSNGASVTLLQNSGSINNQAGNGGSGVSNNGTISSFNNTGTITGENNAILNAASIGTITNSGSLYSTTTAGTGISNSGTISNILNNASGNITGNAIGIFNQGTINSITNYGNINFTGVAGAYSVGISNRGTIGTLTNYQNGLTYQGTVPSTYSPGFSGTNFGTLVGVNSGFTGTGTVSVNPTSWAASKQNFLPIISGTGLTSSTFSFQQQGSTYTFPNGSTYTMSGGLNPKNSTYYLIATCTANCAPVTTLPGVGVVPAPGGPNGNGSYATVGETQIALQQTRVAIQDVAALQTQTLINSFSYDCQVFDVNNICVSAGGRYTNVSPDSVNNSSIILVGAYKVDENTRVGVSIDQNLSASNSNGIVNQSNKLPMFGAFAVWNQNPSLIGWSARANIGYGQKGMDVTRPVITAAQANDIDGTASEQGQGSTKVSTFGAQAIGRYGFDVAMDTVISPYLGLRYNKSSVDGYTEASSLIVALPLTYSQFGSTATTGLLGGKLDYKTGPWSAWLNLGMEYDMNYSNDYINVTGFGNVSGGGYYNPSNVRSRFVSGAYGAYDIAKNQRVSLKANFRQTEFSGVNSASIMAFYSMGF
jgi:uncharacterized protein YhjY with autotransporter beta-barrel domain